MSPLRPGDLHPVGDPRALAAEALDAVRRPPDHVAEIGLIDEESWLVGLGDSQIDRLLADRRQSRRPRRFASSSFLEPSPGSESAVNRKEEQCSDERW